MGKIIEEARIVSNERVSGQIYRLLAHSPAVAGSARCGQFVMVRIGKGIDPFLRRPFSFSRIHAKDGEFEILYRVVGGGTFSLSRLRPGETRGGGTLGNGFDLPVADRNEPLAVIAGGIGVAPLLELIVQVISHRGKKGAENLRLFYGARSAYDLLPEAYLAPLGLRALCHRRRKLWRKRANHASV